MRKVLEIFGEPILNGGQEAFVMNVLGEIDSREFRIDLLTPYICGNEYYRQKVEEKGGNIYELKLPFEPGKKRNNIVKPLARFLAENKYDVVHIHSGSISVLAYAAKVARKSGIKKVIVHSHCAGDRNPKHLLVKILYSPLIIKYPTEYCACSNVAGKSKFPVFIVKNKMKIMKNGIVLKNYKFDNSVREKLRKEYGISNKEFVIGHVGRFARQKNHEYLINIFEKVKNRIPKAKLVLIGNGELQEKIIMMVQQKNLTDSVFFIGNVNDVQNYYQMMDVFVLPSLFEGLPIVGIEAQANGLPVLVSDRVSKELGITDSVKYISLENIEKWSDYICEYQKYTNRSDNYIALKMNGYDINETVKKIVKIYESN